MTRIRLTTAGLALLGLWGFVWAAPAPKADGQLVGGGEDDPLPERAVGRLGSGRLRHTRRQAHPDPL